MIRVLRENALYRVDLDEDRLGLHPPRRSLGTYRVLDIKSQQVLFETYNRDKSFGVFEYATQEAALR